MNTLYPRLTRTLEWLAPGYEGRYTVYSIMDGGGLHCYGFSKDQLQSAPSFSRFANFETACAVVEALVKNRVENDTTFGPMCRELPPIERND